MTQGLHARSTSTDSTVGVLGGVANVLRAAMRCAGLGGSRRGVRTMVEAGR